MRFPRIRCFYARVAQQATVLRLKRLELRGETFRRLFERCEPSARVAESLARRREALLCLRSGHPVPHVRFVILRPHRFDLDRERCVVHLLRRARGSCACRAQLCNRIPRVRPPHRRGIVLLVVDRDIGIRRRLVPLLRGRVLVQRA